MDIFEYFALLEVYFDYFVDIDIEYFFVALAPDFVLFDIYYFVEEQHYFYSVFALLFDMVVEFEYFLYYFVDKDYRIISYIMIYILNIFILNYHLLLS